MQVETSNNSPRTSRASTAIQRGNTGDSQRVTRGGSTEHLLSAIQAKEGSLLTGKKSKVDCLRSAGIERLVGSDVPAWQGMRVVVSSRATVLRKPGPAMAGDVVEVTDGGRACVVKWDDGSGPFQYSTSVEGGLELAEVISDFEPAVPASRGREVVRFLAMGGVSAAGERLLEGLRDEGYLMDGTDGTPPAGGSGALQALLGRCDVYMVFVNRQLLRALQQGGAVRKELEYAVQELPASSILTVSLDDGARLSPHLGAVAVALSKAPHIDLSASSDGDALGRCLQVLGQAPSRACRQASGRPATTASRLNPARHY